MNTELLEKIGLSKAEIKAYVALLELGVTTTGALTKKSGIPSSNIYPVLNELISKGLVSYTITANKKYFRAEDPQRLTEFVAEQKQNLEAQETKLKEVVSELIKKQVKTEAKQETYIYGGIKGIKTALEFFLKVIKKNDTFYVIDASRSSNEKLMGYFNDFHKRRAQQKINYKIIYGHESMQFAKERKTYALTKVKVLPKTVRIPSVFWIFQDYVVISVFSEEPVALVIKSQQISDSFMAYFDVMWNISEDLK